MYKIDKKQKSLIDIAKTRQHLNTVTGFEPIYFDCKKIYIINWIKPANLAI